MRILVCVKRVPAPGAKINVTADEQSVDTAHLGFTTSPHEECALEEAVQIVEREGGDVVVLTLGPAEAEEQLRYAASVGGTQFVLIPTDGSDWDPQRTAGAITEAIRSLEADGGEPLTDDGEARGVAVAVVSLARDLDEGAPPAGAREALVDLGAHGRDML